MNSRKKLPYSNELINKTLNRIGFITCLPHYLFIGSIWTSGMVLTILYLLPYYSYFKTTLPMVIISAGMLIFYWNHFPSINQTVESKVRQKLPLLPKDFWESVEIPSGMKLPYPKKVIFKTANQICYTRSAKHIILILLMILIAYLFVALYTVNQYSLIYSKMIYVGTWIASLAYAIWKLRYSPSHVMGKLKQQLPLIPESAWD